MDINRPYWNMEIEPILNTPGIREIQLQKIQKLVRRLYEDKPSWRKYLNDAGIRQGEIRTLDDFSRRIPVFDKARRRRIFEECGGDMVKVVDSTIGVGMDQLCLMAATSGTTGEPTPYPMTRKDIQWFSENLSRVLYRIGVRPGSRLIHGFGLSMFLAGVPYAQCFEASGACVIPVGAEGGSQKILTFAKMFQADTLACTPSLAEHLLDTAPEEVRALSIRRLLCGGEPGAGIPEVRKRLESGFGAKLYDTGAGFGISCDLPEYQGMHHIADDSIYFELVDPDTYEPIPFEDGAIGMPVQTTLEGEGFLWFRETIGDICQVFTEPCSCGHSGFRYKVVGRKDDMLKVKGVIVYPAAIDGLINGFVPRVTGEFRIILDEAPPRVVPPLKLKVEHGEGIGEDALEALAHEIGEAMHSRLKVTPMIQWLAPNTLERSDLKTKLFEKNY